MTILVKLSVILISLIVLTKTQTFEDFEDNDIYQEVRESRNFDGKTVLVTGSSNGIGAQIVKLYSALGANVVITGRKVAEIHKTAQQVQALSPKKIKPLEVVADLTKPEELENLVNQTIKQFGGLDVLVNDAGHYDIMSVLQPKFMDSLNLYEKLDINGNIQLARLSAPHLIKTKGNIVQITTVQMDRPQILQLGYQISKASLSVMTQVLALELAPHGIRVNSISPGIINSRPEAYEPHKIEAIVNKTAKYAPLGRVGESIDIAKAVVFLSSTDAQYITGHNLIVDGGLRYNMDSNFINEWL